MRVLWLAIVLFFPAAAGALPAPSRMPSGLLMAGTEGATYTVTPEGGVLPENGLVSFFPEGSEALWPVVQAPAWVLRGRILRVLCASPERLPALGATLRSPGGEPLAAGRAFEIPVVALHGEPLVTTPPSREPGASPSPAGPEDDRDRVYLYAMLLGVPAEGEAASCRLEVRGASGGRSFSYAARVDVFALEARVVRIPLGAALTSLRTRTDARAIRDLRRLEEAERSFTPTSVFQLDPLRLPLGGVELSASFADRRIYQYHDGRTASSTHQGVDMVEAAGTPVHAAGRGRVVLAFYYHLSSLSVSVGQVVEPGEVVGRVGATGLATGPHLHWELCAAGVAVEPLSVLDRPLVDKAEVFRIIVACQSQKRRR